jgi:hypothetical protein
MIEANGQVLTGEDLAAAERIAERLGAFYMSLYCTSEGLQAFVIDNGGGEHLGVKIATREGT